MSKSNVAWIWQAAMAVPFLIVLSGVKPLPQVVVVAMLLVVALVQRVFPDERASRILRTIVMAATSWVVIAWVVAAVAMAATRDLEHPTMPIGELLLGTVCGTIAACLVLWLRSRGRDRWAELEAPARTFNERYLAGVIELFALAAVLRVGLDCEM